MNARSGIRLSTWAFGAGCALACGAVLAQSEPRPNTSFSPTHPQASLGLQPGSMQVSVGCGASLLPCRTDEEAFAARSDPSALRWSIEVAPLQLGAATRAGTGSARQGLNLSLVGKRPLFGSSFSVYGRLGTTYGATEPSGTLPAGLAAADNSYGKSFGAGVAMDFTPRLSATFGWDSRDLQLGSGQRDPVRATSMGLQYRY